jgi:tetratricopeptide (TPR) repeat protein
VSIDNGHAIEIYEQALVIVRETYDRRSELDILNNLGKIFVSISETQKAINFYEDALAIVHDLAESPPSLQVEPRSLRVFLSHSSRDKSFVRKLYSKLSNYGIDVWLDEKKLIPGQVWELEIEKAIQYSDAILVCLSTQSVGSEGYIYKEIKYALDRADKMPEGEIFIIPCRFDNVSMPQRLGRFQWVDLFASDGFDKLIQSLSFRANKLGLETISKGMIR